MCNPITIAFVGCGFVAQQCHLPCFAANPRFAIKYLVDPHPDLVKKLARIYEVENVASSHKDIVNLPDIDAVIITLPRKLTANVVLDFLRAGKNVFTEKPISLNSQIMSNFIQASRLTGAYVMTGYMRQHDLGTIELRKRLRDSDLSELISVFAYCHMGYSYASPFGDIKGESITDIKYDFQMLPDWLTCNRENSFEQFINVFSHITHTLEHIFEGQLTIISHSTNEHGEGFILCDLNSISVCLELIRGKQYNWNEGIVVTFRDHSLHLRYPAAFLRNQPAELLVSPNSQDTSFLQYKPQWSWAFLNQTYAFYDFLMADSLVKEHDMRKAFHQVQFAEELFQQLSYDD